MGAAVVRQLAPLGAEIHVIDLKEPPVPVAGFHAVDLMDPEATAAAVDAIGGTIHGLFNCAGLPGGRFSDLDTMLVNFVGQRHLADLVVERMEPGAAIASISSGAGAGWQGNVEKWMPLVTTEGFAAGKQWLEDHPDRDCQRIRSLEGSHHRLDGVAFAGVGREGDPHQLHSAGSHRHAHDAGLRGADGQGVHGQLPDPARSSPDTRRAGCPLVFLNSPAASAITGESHPH